MRLHESCFRRQNVCQLVEGRTHENRDDRTRSGLGWSAAWTIGRYIPTTKPPLESTAQRKFGAGRVRTI